MKYILVALLLGMVIIMVACGGRIAKVNAAYRHISQQQAKEIMDNQNAIILDVREQEEYDDGHIADAVLLPVNSINETTAAANVPEKDSVILVYCRSGNRSKKAAKMLAELGYTQVCEFGGINTWPYGIIQ